MKSEIEFLAVGEFSKAGDAIVIRHGEPANYNLMIVDGGLAKTGDDLVNHLRRFYGNNVRVGDVVLTHCDRDHAGGLRELLETIPVDRLWVIPPWAFVEESLRFFKDKTLTVESLTRKLRDEYDIISDLVDVATAQGCSIHVPVAGEWIGPFRVLSPSRFAYARLVPQFDRSPEPDKEALESVGMWLPTKPPGFELLAGLMGLVEKAASAVQNWIPESWSSERLKDGGQTSASNESSLVLYGQTDSGPVLLTGDAGINALNWSADFAEALMLPLQQFSFIQIPHHGSRRNVGPTILNRLIGDIVPEGTQSKFTAFVSAPKDDLSHPRKMVTNAFIRRGGNVIATQGDNKVFWGGFPPRPGYWSAIPLDFAPMVEEYT